MSHENGSLKAVVTALAGNLVVTLIKFAGWIISASPSMLAEALHSFADVLNQMLLLAGIKSAHGSSAQHPWGHGARQYLFNFLSAIGIFTLGCIVTLGHAIHEYLEPSTQVNHRWLQLSIVILLVSLATEGYTCWVALKEIYRRKGRQSLLKFLRKTDDPTLVGIFLEDSAALLGILVALGGIGLSYVTDSRLPDIIAAGIIGVMMGLIAIFLAFTNAAFLVGKSTGKDEEYKEAIEALDTVEKVTDIKTEVLGPRRVHLSIKVELHPTFIIDIDQLKLDAEAIKEGESPLKILMESSDRAVRTTAREVASIEKFIKKKFPEVISIDLELN